MIHCPKCGFEDSLVIDSRKANHETYQDGYIRRRRECNSCGYRFSTYEMSQKDYDVTRGILDMLRKAGYEKVRTGK